MTKIVPLDLGDVTITELRHRIKNLITVVQALVSQSLRSSCTKQEAALAVEERLSAIARSVDVLLRTDWRPMDLGELIRTALTHAEAFPGRVHISGPPVEVIADWALILILALHELETNAIKYGALSNGVGEVTVSWCTVPSESGGRSLWLQWTEQGGPTVTPPDGTGFGSKLATTLLQRHLKGTAEFDFVSTGATWRLVAPLEAGAAEGRTPRACGLS